jgi:hypothetical protein
MVSGQTTNGQRMGCLALHQEIVRQSESDARLADFLAEPRVEEIVREGAGCWHPTFPAAGFEVELLASFAVERLNAVLTANTRVPWALIARAPQGKPSGVDIGVCVEWFQEFS